MATVAALAAGTVGVASGAIPGAAGTVAVAVSATTGAVTLNCVTNTSANCGAVSNNLPGTAHVLQGIDGDFTPSSTTISDTTCAGQFDWFEITVHETDTGVRDLQFQVRLTSVSGDSDVCLFSEFVSQLACSTLSSNLDVISWGVPDPPFSGTNTTTFLIRVAAVEPGDYTLEVRSI